MGEKLKVLDLFSGIGGFSLGLEAAGMETVAFCEVSAAPRALLSHHWPKVPCYDDVQTLTAERLATDGIGVDVLCGGFPCQDISYAGAGAGLDGARSGLFWEIVRLVRELIAAGRRPRYIVLENVAALLGRGLGVVLGALAALGYDLWWDCIPASAVGARHRRDRIWIVAYPRGEQHQGFGDAFRWAVAEELSRAALANANGRLHASGLGTGADRSAPSGSEGGDGSERQASYRERLWPKLGAGGQDVADAACELRNWSGFGAEQDRRPQSKNRSQTLGDTDSAGLPVAGVAGGQSQAAGCIEAWRAANRAGWWSAEPDVGRVAHGVPARVDRLHGLGNAVVPQIPEILGRAIIAAEEQCARLAA